MSSLENDKFLNRLRNHRSEEKTHGIDMAAQMPYYRLYDNYIAKKVAEKKAAAKERKAKKQQQEEAPMIQNQAASTTLGDIDALAALKQQLEGKK